MRVKLTSVLVKDQEKALQFYTRKLGFLKKRDIPMGEHRWLTVVSAEEPDGVEIVLEPMAFPPAVGWQEALYKAGIPATAFYSVNVDAEYERLLAAGVVFSMPPTMMGPAKIAVFDDTCGNNIQIFQVI